MATAHAPQRFDDPKGPIEVDADGEFEITLDSNPSTGYSWKLTKPLKDGPVEYRGQDYEPSETDEQIVGAGGTAILKFRALESGEASIELEYVGPGSDATVAERRTILSHGGVLIY